MIRYLTKEQILLIHSMAVDETGGGHGVRDLDAIRSVEALPKQAAFGKEFYPTIWEKAAVYVRNIVQGHPFVDGNKRTGVACAFVFLEDNGYASVAKRGEIEAFALRVVAEKLEIKVIAAWLKVRARKVPRKKKGR